MSVTVEIMTPKSASLTMATANLKHHLYHVLHLLLQRHFTPTAMLIHTGLVMGGVMVLNTTRMKKNNCHVNPRLIGEGEYHHGENNTEERSLIYCIPTAMLITHPGLVMEGVTTQSSADGTKVTAVHIPGTKTGYFHNGLSGKYTNDSALYDLSFG